MITICTTEKVHVLYAKGNDNLYYADWNASVIYKIDLTTNPLQKTVFAGILNAQGGELSKRAFLLLFIFPFCSQLFLFQVTMVKPLMQELRTLSAINPVNDEAYIANSFNHTIQKVNGNGIISHLGGKGCEYRSSYVDNRQVTLLYCWANVCSSEMGTLRLMHT